MADPEIPEAAIRVAAEAIERELMSGRIYSGNVESDEELARVARAAALPHLDEIRFPPRYVRAERDAGEQVVDRVRHLRNVLNRANAHVYSAAFIIGKLDEITGDQR